MIGSKIYVSVVGILVIWFVWQGQRTMAQYLWIMEIEGKFKKFFKNILCELNRIKIRDFRR